MKVLLIASAVALMWLLQGTSATLAHGKELTLKVSSFAPDEGRPLVRLFRVQVLYANDLQPVADAKVRLSAARQGGGPQVEDLLLQPLNEPGLYAVEVDFPLFGAWDLTLQVIESGQGEVSFTEELSPSAPVRDNDEVRRQVLSIFFRFDWKDVAAIAVRIVHALASGIWFSFTAVILASFWFVSPSSRADLFRRLSPIFAPASYAAVMLLLLTGIYTGIYSAPVNPPGIFDFDVMFRVPFGAQYLGAIGFKVLVLITYAGVTSHMARHLKAAYLHPAEVPTEVPSQRAMSDAEKKLLRLTTVNAALGILMVGAISIAIYLHYISHLAVFVPE